jgi:flavin-dependent dehydrogenase
MLPSMGGGTEQFDVAIVGARCAGSPIAAMLARRGLSVCLLDKARFPSDTPSTHVIQPCGVAVLDRLGTLEPLFAAGAAHLTRFTLTTEDARIDASIDASEFGAPALSMRRVKLDQLLVERAASAGVDVRTGTPVTSLLWRDRRVAGVETRQGSVGARVVIGADGRGSTVAGLVGAAKYNVAPAGRMFAWTYFEGVPDAEAEGHLRLGSLGGLTFVASPTDAGLFLAAVCPPLAGKDAFLADREAGFQAAIATWSELDDLLARANRVSPIRAMVNWHGYFREAAGPGWALLGDAGNFKDPSPAQGISDALRQAERLADAVTAGLQGTTDIDEELRRWWEWRDEDAFEMHWFAADMGAASRPSPLADQFIADIAGDEEATGALLGVLNHEVRPAQLFTPRRLGRAAARAIRKRPGQIPAMMREAGAELRNEARRARQRYRSPLRSRREEFELLRPLVTVWLLAAAALLVSYWVAWFTDRALVASAHTSEYVAFEQSFPLADAWLVLTVSMAAIALWQRRPSALIWLTATGGAGIYLFALDVLYDLEHGIYATGVNGLIELLINFVTLVSSAGIISFSWRFREQLLGTAIDPSNCCKPK